MKKEVFLEPESTFFWYTQHQKTLKTLNILNPDDFILPDQDLRTLPSLGLADHEEIIGRNEIMSFIFNDKKFHEKIKEWVSIACDNSSLPQSENQFLNFYEKNQHPYWLAVDEIINYLREKENVPVRLQNFISQLKASQILTSEEKTLADEIKKRLETGAFMKGIITFIINETKIDSDFDSEKSFIIGRKAFNSSWSADYLAPIKKMYKNPIFEFLGITRRIQKRANRVATRKSKKSLAVTNIPYSLKSDIFKFLKEMINDSEKKTGTSPLKNKTIEMPVFFQYNENGLEIKPIALTWRNFGKTKIAENFEIVGAHRNNDIADSYSGKKRRKILKEIHDFNKNVENIHSFAGIGEAIDYFKKNTGLSIGKSYKINSSQTDYDFRWNFLGNLYNEFKTSHGRLTRNRQFFYNNILQLNSLCKTIDKFREMAKNKKLPLCMPTIKESGSGINFENLAPINMFSQEKEMIPFSFPRINGHMICLTGRHGRGKSVSGKSVLESIWMAQSGLPVFANKFETDIKDVIGAVVNDEGEGSTATVFIDKTLNLLKQITKIPTEKSLVFIDEIGKGTQEESGLNLGKRLLGKLAKGKYSVIFNTQIIPLAQYAENNLGAICMKVKNNHQFEPGIGTGEMEKLIKERGLDKYLN